MGTIIMSRNVAVHDKTFVLLELVRDAEGSAGATTST
jgi:hypothetical protein